MSEKKDLNSNSKSPKNTNIRDLNNNSKSSKKSNKRDMNSNSKSPKRSNIRDMNSNSKSSKKSNMRDMDSNSKSSKKSNMRNMDSNSKSSKKSNMRNMNSNSTSSKKGNIKDINTTRDTKNTLKSSKDNVRKVNFNNKSSTSKSSKLKANPNLVDTNLQKDFSSTKGYNEVNTSVKRKNLFTLLVCCIIVFSLLVFRIGYIQFVQGADLKESANRQQTTNRIISPKRGNIYDSNGKIIARSAQVDTVSINPTRIKDENKEKVAKAFSEIFGLDYEETLNKVKSTSNIETIAKKVEQDTIDKLTAWMDENDLYSGINIDEDAKRYYPYDNLASNLIGFCGTDNQGLWGLELYWDKELAGTPGKIVAAKDVTSDLIPDKEGTYVPAENGSNLTLTLDINIQTIVEKYLKQAVIENNCANGGSAIIMNPTNGDILAMASYPDYNLNTPFEPNESLQATWEGMDTSQKSDALNKMWRNRNVSDGYEPGSCFKIITAAIGVEEGFADTDTPNDFLCSGYEMINGIRIDCWKNETTHGYQTLRNALENSCNPALMQLGKRIGKENLYKYYEAFGLFSKTGIATSGESSVPSNFWKYEDVGPVEIATMSFGQRFTITPIQLVTAVSAIANDGILMQPRIVKQIENSDTHAITTVEPVAVRQVVSKETASKVLNMLESVVENGTGHYAQVAGYSIAGKTGTSEPIDSDPNGGYVASFVGIAPSQDPAVVILLALYSPPRYGDHQGGSIAAPVVSQILTEVLPYLNIPSDYVESSSNNTGLTTKSLIDVRNKTLAQAKNELEALGFKCNISTSDTTKLVSDQVPKPGTALLDGACVNLYTDDSDARISQEVPNLKGKTVYQAKNMLTARNLNIHVTGSGVILSQDPMAGTPVEEGTVINVTLQEVIQDTH